MFLVAAIHSEIIMANTGGHRFYFAQCVLIFVESREEFCYDNKESIENFRVPRVPVQYHMVERNPEPFLDYKRRNSSYKAALTKPLTQIFLKKRPLTQNFDDLVHVCEPHTYYKRTNSPLTHEIGPPKILKFCTPKTRHLIHVSMRIYPLIICVCDSHKWTESKFWGPLNESIVYNNPLCRPILNLWEF